MPDYKICDQPGPCWDGYVYVGPEPKTSGSCISKDKLCKKKKIGPARVDDNRKLFYAFL